MFFVQQNNSIRTWFQAIKNTGELRNGLEPVDFNITVISADDITSIMPQVSESMQRPGNYYFDIPSSFLLTGGLGSYNISIEINTFFGTGAPNIRTSASKILQVSKDDFDSLSDAVNIVSGVVSYIRDIEAGTWIITGSEMIFFNSGSNDELARFKLQDMNGTDINPLTQDPFRRKRI